MPSLIDVITIGTELILGRIADTNAQYLARQITCVGGRVRRVTTIRDDPDEIVATISSGIAGGATHIITTGGLGPTPDDITVETVARMIGSGMTVDEGLIEHFRKKLRLEGREQVMDHMRKAATIPEAGAAAPNHSGWGHCITLTHNDVTIFILPGPPREVQALFSAYIEPELKKVAP